ncbi:acyl-CoA dehydrogenase family protein [Priestia aryabhattai]|uniref:acyl-CoA dehydrogenase family protein n=1 Tax=Priestia aryabhattai TaxID=412384 RepID=UPI001594DD26
MPIHSPMKRSIQEQAYLLAAEFQKTAIQRDRKGGNPKWERDLIRKSGLLNLLIPERLGGMGKTWGDVCEVVQIFAQADSSLAHVYGYHFLNLTTPYFYGTSEQSDFYYQQTIQQNLFWGNAFNPIDLNLFATKKNSSILLNGKKTFCSGSADSDYLIVSSIFEKTEVPLIAVIPTNRQGIEVNGDWDHFGQRQTDSGSITFKNVPVYKEDILAAVPPNDEFLSIRSSIANFLISHIMLGVTKSAINEALQYVSTKTRARFAQHSSAIDDPYIQRHLGKFHIQYEAAESLISQTTTAFQEAWEKGWNLTEKEKTSIQNSIGVAKAFITTAGLDITSRIFDVMGSRATSNTYRYDRFWRNIRTLSLHAPIDYEIQRLGTWTLQNYKNHLDLEENQ